MWASQWHYCLWVMNNGGICGNLARHSCRILFNNHYALHRVVWQQFIGEVGKYITFQCWVSSGQGQHICISVQDKWNACSAVFCHTYFIVPLVHNVALAQDKTRASAATFSVALCLASLFLSLSFAVLFYAIFCNCICSSMTRASQCAGKLRWKEHM